MKKIILKLDQATVRQIAIVMKETSYKPDSSWDILQKELENVGNLSDKVMEITDENPI